jgi:hypothetical protein
MPPKEIVSFTFDLTLGRTRSFSMFCRSLSQNRSNICFQPTITDEKRAERRERKKEKKRKEREEKAAAAPAPAVKSKPSLSLFWIKLEQWCSFLHPTGTWS